MSPRPGTKPLPTVVRLMDDRSKRPVPTGEPEPRARLARRPKNLDWLPPEAQAEWRRMAPDLAKLGLLTVLDRTALAAYCQAYASWKEAVEVLNTKGKTYVTPQGVMRQRPEVAMARDASRLMLAYAAEFGMTPSARANMRSKTAEALNPALAEFNRFLERWRDRIAARMQLDPELEVNGDDPEES